MKDSYKRKLIAAFEAVDALIMADEDLVLQENAELGGGVVHLNSVVTDNLEIKAGN